MLRQIFSAKYGALAYDCEFDAVIESVQGNCRDSFAVSLFSKKNKIQYLSCVIIDSNLL